MRILVFGDSIVQGFWDSEGGWVNRLRKFYDLQKISGEVQDPPTVFNLGISGETTAGLLKRFTNEVEARKFAGEEFVFVFGTGTNDTIYRGEQNETEPEQYEEQLKQLSELAKKYSNKIMFVGLFPVIDNLLQPMPWSSTGKCYSTERIELFDKTLKKFCLANNLPVVDIFSKFSEVSELGSLLEDGIHPSSVGHELIAGLVKPELEKLIF
jgi:lysophospholipase L1-like esterase